MLTAEIERKSHIVDALRTGMRQAIVGQEHLVDSLLISLLSGGHILLEGLPGLAKTLAIKTLAQLIQADYKRIQFTPDDVQPEARGLPGEEGADLLQLHPRGRDQPSSSQGTECPLGGHAGASGDGG